MPELKKKKRMIKNFKKRGSKFKRLKKTLKHKISVLKKTYSNFTLAKASSVLSELCYKITIRSTQNNIYCTLSNVANKKVIFVISSGKCKINTSKKSLKFNSKQIIRTFLKKIRKHFKKGPSTLIVINLPKRLRKSVLKTIRFSYLKKKSRLIIELKNKKCFNGCRLKKKKRKKRSKFRVFKK